MHHTLEHPFVKFAAATLVNALALVTSFQEQLEWGLRCGSLVVGMCVGVFTIYSIVKRGRQ